MAIEILLVMSPLRRSPSTWARSPNTMASAPAVSTNSSSCSGLVRPNTLKIVRPNTQNFSQASSAPMEPKQLELTGQPCEWKHLAGISTESPNISYLPYARHQVENLQIQFVLQWCLAVFRSDVFQNIHETNFVFEGRIQLLAPLDIHFILR